VVFASRDLTGPLCQTAQVYHSGGLLTVPNRACNVPAVLLRFPRDNNLPYQMSRLVWNVAMLASLMSAPVRRSRHSLMTSEVSV